MSENSKKLNLFDLISIGVGSVIGAGIFSMLGSGYAMTGRSIATALIFAMFLVFMQTIRQLFMSSMFALDGGMYAQQALILPPVLTGMSSIILVMSNLSFSVFGISIASYLTQLIPALAPYQTIIGVLVLTLFFGLSISGSKGMAKVQNVMALVMYAALALFVVMGLINRDPASYAGEPYFISSSGSFLMAIAIMSFTCNGASNLLNLTGDAKNPKKNIPLGFFLTTVVCALIYFLLGTAFGSAGSYSELAGQNLGFVAQKVMPHALYLFFIIGGAIFALTTSLLGGVAAMKFPILASAEDGWLPKVFTLKTKKGFPYVIMGFMYLLAVVPVLGGFTLDSIVSFILVPGMILGVVCNLFSLKLPKQFPEAWKNAGLHCPYWLYVVAIIVSIFASLFTAVFSLMSLNTVGIIGNLSLTAAMFVYAWWRHKKGYVKLVSVQDVKDE